MRTSHHFIQDHVNQYVGSSPSHTPTAVHHYRGGSAPEALVYFPARDKMIVCVDLSHHFWILTPIYI